MRIRAVVRDFVKYARFFGVLTGWRFAVLVVLTLASTWAEGIAIALLAPLLSAGRVPDSSVGSVIGAMLDFLHVSRTIEGLLFALVVFSFAKGALVFALVAWQHHIAAKTTQDLRRQLLTGLEASDYRWFLRQNASKLSVIITGETMSVTGGFLAFSRIFPHGLTALAFLAVVAWVEPVLAAVVIAFGAVMAWVLTIPRRLTMRFAEQNNAEVFGMGSLMLQSLFSFKYLAGTGTLARVHDRLRTSFRRITVINYKLGVTAAFAGAFPQPMVAIVLAGLLLYLHRSRGEAALAAGLVILLFLYRAINEINAIQAQWQNFASTIPSIEAVRTLAAEFAANREVGGKDPPPPVRDAIRLENVRFRYDEKDVLAGVNLTLPSRKLVALVGSSGGGKTTIADLITGLLRPASGRVLVDGKDLSTLDLHAWRNRIGYVPQDAPVFTATIAENIAFHAPDLAAPGIRDRVIEAGTRALCHEFVSELPRAWDEPAGERGNRLSGGQKQRIAIARELFKFPDLLILDEATSALDAESENAFRQNLLAMRGTVTGLVIAHRLSTVKACDLVAVLEGGRIVEEGSVSELLERADSRFSELARLQSF